MKNRVTVFLKDQSYRMLRVMAAEEGVGMSAIIEDFILGERRNVSDPEEIKEVVEDNRLCDHCGGLIKIANPTGNCSHIYYPEDCPTCLAARNKNES